ncbi:hypothetical protein [Sphaerothrix gracilis]|uniref:hypothetical protein n=1 Tax=Sphaerothrix gracilis TaxID=3151835 RepID=UPI0031FC6B06
MRLAKALGLAAGMSAAVGASSPIQAAEVIGGPTGSQFQIGQLSDGNYRFCSDRPPEDIQQVSGVCFRFRKQGNSVVGDYYYPYEGSSLCINGQVNGNTVTGQGVERLGPNSDRPLYGLPEARAAWRSETFDETFLQVGRSQLVVRNEQPDRIRYRSLILNLNNFYWYNAGTVLPPASCFDSATDPAVNRQYAAVPEFLTFIGESEYYAQPIYLNTDSVESVADQTYRYTTRIGITSPEVESDLIVDCSQPEQVRWLRSRYYDRGDVSEVEEVDQVQPLSPEGTNADKYRANQLVCNQLGEEAAATQPLEIPENIVYERYSNNRFDFSLRYPANLVTPQAAPTNNDGRVFQSANSQITIRAFGRNNSLSTSLETAYQQAMQAEDRDVTYNTLGDRYFVVSGYEAGRIFYEKTVLENGVFKSLVLSYDEALQPQFDAVVAEVASSFPG